jgi:pimeloyl-ACP methyl ester carboxylesterase
MTEKIRSSEQFVAVPGGQLYVKRWQPETENKLAPMVLLHDSLGCVELWRDFPAQLCEATGRTAIAYDRLGFGRSSRRHRLPSQRFVSEEAELYLPPLLAALQLNQVVLYGHSVGGGMAIIAAGQLAERCLAVISESAQAFVEQRTLEGIRQAQSGFEDARAFGKLQQYHGDKAEWVLRAWTDTWTAEGFARWSLADDLPRMRCPALIIHGDRDEYGSTAFPETICRLAAGPTQLHVLPRCGHVPHRSHRDLVLALIAGFLSVLGTSL